MSTASQGRVAPVLRLASGGMGTVWLATAGGEALCIKKPHEHLAFTACGRDRDLHDPRRSIHIRPKLIEANPVLAVALPRDRILEALWVQPSQGLDD